MVMIMPDVDDAVTIIIIITRHHLRGWSGGAMVLGKLPVPGRPTIWFTVGQGLLHLQYVRVGVVWTFLLSFGWSGGAMVLGKLPVPGRSTTSGIK